MKILVDADACPVKEIILAVAKETKLPVLMFIDTSHELSSDYAKIIQVSKGSDAADFALIGQTNAGDIVITQDYGVAALALAKKAYAIHQNGWLFTDDNIDRLMMERHFSKKARRSGKRIHSTSKRTKVNDLEFQEAFRKLIASLMGS